MKDIVEPEATDHATETEGFANRKLIRPVLRPEHGQHASIQANHGNGVNHAVNHAVSNASPNHNSPSHNSGHGHVPNHVSNHGHGPNHVSNHTHGALHSGPGDRRGPSGGKKTPPAEITHAENFYYQKQMQGKTHMVIVLRDGEEVHGFIEWYDRSCLKLNRLDGPNLMIYKPSIKYMYKEGEAR